MSAVTQAHLPFTPWADPGLARLPGMVPVEGSWIVVDDAYAAQMSERVRLLRSRPGDVMAVLPGAEPLVAELSDVVDAALPDMFRRVAGGVQRPDGVRVDDGPPALGRLGRLLQEDLLLLARDGAEHVLVAGLLCFPASWTLAEKMGRPLTRIHRPVPDYAGDLAGRVQRLFDRVPPGRPMWRANALGYADRALYQPRAETAPRDISAPVRYVRSERQTVLKLPRTGAVLFAVHTYVVPVTALTRDQRASCPFLEESVTDQ